MKRTAIALATAGTLAFTAIAAPAPAEARGGFWPGLAGGLIAGAVIGGVASTAYGWGPGYGWGYGWEPAAYSWGPGYAYAPAYRYAPAYYGGWYGPAYSTRYVTYYDRTYPPVVYRPRVRPVVRSSFAYWGGPYHRWHHRHYGRRHRHW